MSLTISYVSRLEDIVEPAWKFLSRDYDLFAKPRIVVPTAGAKAWLWSQLAQTLGASRGGPDGGGGSLRDGIVANVEISYPGTILALLQPPRGRESDPWSFDRLTFTVLDMITGPEAAGLGIPFDVSREPLLAARRIAGLFDEYHVRRPGMIARWEAGQAHLSPVATNARDKDGQWAADPLAAEDTWQFRVWAAIRGRIGAPSPVPRMGYPILFSESGLAIPLESVDDATSPPLLVAGLQSLSLAQITALKRLAERGEVQALLVHPSPVLRSRWAKTAPPESLNVPPPRTPAELPEDLDPLVAAWLHGARETQMLLASQGLSPAHETAPASAARGGPSLLERLQRSITTAEKPGQQPHDLATDTTVTIHHCHTLSRQAEVIHDALLHAFNDLDGLQPHEVVIVSPCLEQLAPHLEAVFAREVTGRRGRTVNLPLVVADRGLNQVSEAAKLLIDVMRLVGSRCSVEDFRNVAEHPLVTQHFGVDDDMSRLWDGLIDRTRIHWGFDTAHRLRDGFPAEAGEPYTWRTGLERMILGAVLPAGASNAIVGGSVPLDDVLPGELEGIATLARIHEVVRMLDDACHGDASGRSTAEWCDAIEGAMFGLCGSNTSDLAEPLKAVRRLREAASETKVPFHDVRTLLEESLTSVIGRQPLHTGAITATSMVPLRDVPFRVVCIAGYDDGVVTAAESEGDDLVSRQSLAGDGDPRIDGRRALLDYVLATRERLLITCTGMDGRTNKPLPLVTPLSELVDFAVRHGVRPAGGDDPSGIEVRHPRHAIGRRNFVVGAVQPGRRWSHDADALAASNVLDADAPTQTTHATVLREMPIIELADLESMVRDPLKLYLQKSLGIDTRREDDDYPAATFPLTLHDWDAEALALDLLKALLAGDGDDDQCIERWRESVRRTGQVPFGLFGDAAIEKARQLAMGFKKEAAAEDPAIPLHGFESLPVNIQLPAGRLTGTIPILHKRTNQLVDVRMSEGDKKVRGLPIHVAGLRLLVAQAGADAEHPAPARSLVVARHQNWVVGGEHEAMIARPVTLAPALANREAALARLTHICDLLLQAMAAPCGRFGGAAAATVEDREGGRVAFNSFVNRPGFPHTREAVVYGLNPRFDDVFAADSPELRFHAGFERAICFPPRRYELS